VRAEGTHAFKITEPAAGAILGAGQTVTAHVDLGNDTGIIKVRYYWYGEQDDTLVEQDDATAMGSIIAPVALVGLSDHDPAFGGKLVVPKEGIGPMRLLAVAEISRGRLGSRSVFDEILVKAESTAIISAATRTSQATPNAMRRPTTMRGRTAGKITRRISALSAGTSYDSSNPQVIKVLPSGLLQIVGNGKTVLTVKNRDKQAQLDVDVNVNEEPNEPPVADAGDPKTVKAGTKVKLSGLRSRDAEGEALYYAWSQVRGSKVALLDVNGPEATFQAPQVSEARTYRFKLRVTDKKGADSVPAFVDVTVEP
jgi:hypothetical protein